MLKAIDGDILTGGGFQQNPLFLSEICQKTGDYGWDSAIGRGSVALKVAERLADDRLIHGGKVIWDFSENGP